MQRKTTRKLTLGQLGKLSGLARASLLHYESLGLLTPAARSASGYRLYGDAELQRLQAIRRFRNAGLSLSTICDLLLNLASTTTSADKKPVALLEARLLELSAEVENLRSQQQLLAQLLACEEVRKARPCRDKDAWVALLRRAGFNEEAMRQWHVRFETSSPTEHAQFLRSLGLPPSQVAAIRRRSRNHA